MCATGSAQQEARSRKCVSGLGGNAVAKLLFEQAPAHVFVQNTASCTWYRSGVQHSSYEGKGDEE
jgi:hypothetical protein